MRVFCTELSQGMFHRFSPFDNNRRLHSAASTWNRDCFCSEQGTKREEESERDYDDESLNGYLMHSPTQRVPIYDILQYDFHKSRKSMCIRILGRGKRKISASLDGKKKGNSRNVAENIWQRRLT